MLRSVVLIFLLAASLSAFAQTNAPDDRAPPPAGQGGIQSQNILDVKPEVKPDASADPNYLQQNNAQRSRVQPGNNAPMWRGVAAGLEGSTTLPRSQAPEAGVLIQQPVQYPGSRMTTAGEAWRQARNNWIIPYGGALFLIMLGALAIVYFTRGPLRLHGSETGRKIERFTPFERSAHWANAIAFCILAMTGLVMAFGKFFLLPVMGLTLFGWLAYALKNLHNFAGPVFAVSLVIIFLTFLRDNWPQRGDLKWLLKIGGFFDRNGTEPPSHRFNAGEKVVFWGGVFLLGIVVVGSGLVMNQLIPNLEYVRSTMQTTNMIHGVAAVLIMTVFALHIYLGTIGMTGAYTGMRTGYVDETWAREHHEYWYEDIKAGRIPAQRSQPLVLAKDVETARPA